MIKKRIEFVLRLTRVYYHRHYLNRIRAGPYDNNIYSADTL